MDDILGCFSVPLDGRFAAIRSSESNLGNWVSDLLHHSVLEFVQTIVFGYLELSFSLDVTRTF